MLSRVLPECWRGSISTRIVTMFLGLLVVVQLASFAAMRDSLERHARNALPERLAVGQRVLGSLLDQQAQKLVEAARLLTADYGFREALATDDSSTIASVLANHGARIGANEAVLLGTSFQLKAASGNSLPSIGTMVAQLSTLAAARGSAAAIAVVDGRPHQLVMVPVKAPVTVGWVVMGFAIDKRLAKDMQVLSALDVTLLSRADARSDWTLAVSSLTQEQALALTREHWRDGDTEAGTMTSVHVDGAELGMRTHWLTTASTQAHAASVIAIVSLPVHEATRLSSDLQITLAVITSIAFLLALAGSVIGAKQLTTPLGQLSAAVERLGRGDYDTPLALAPRKDEIGHLAQVFEQMRRNVADKQAEVLKLAYWDPLTGLPNRTQFRDAVRNAIDEGGATGTVSVIMLDLDRFKHVNDVLGYRFGDLLLLRVAERLMQQSRGGDLVARLGADKFAVLLADGDSDLALAVARRMDAAFEQPLALEEHTVDMGAGIGIANWPRHASDADTLIGRAEIAMSAAKRRGDEPLMYSQAIDAGSAQTLSMLTELRTAIGQNQLQLFLQPKLALHNAAVVGAEALVRWQHPVQGLVPPAHFIPFAEQTGFIRTLTLWVFEEAARQWRTLQAQGMRFTMSVNLSTRDLLDLDLPQKFDALLLKHQVPAEMFCLEITESAIMDDPQRAQATLDRLSGLGFRLSIDDFGTGYSSLAYLKRLPVDELKIDKSFVMSMTRDTDDAQIVRSTIELAHNLGLSVVAEGVENATAWDMLRDLRCDQAQGFLMGRPMPVADFIRWSTAWAAAHASSSAPGPSKPMVLH